MQFSFDKINVFTIFEFGINNSIIYDHGPIGPIAIPLIKFLINEILYLLQMIPSMFQYSKSSYLLNLMNFIFRHINFVKYSKIVMLNVLLICHVIN